MTNYESGRFTFLGLTMFVTLMVTLFGGLICLGRRLK